ncbi:Uncharacterized protein M6B38_232440 [Iris pallida]|uniref:Uncharacterized protein n=1 Tax=Iris pallida TaxID=29817 RepID=A0AAX6DRG6_IRIPA|nr:Uncharacterized protein M6B38_232440 [Iris pallida]
MSWRYLDGQRCKIQQLKDVRGKSGKNVLGIYKSNSNLTRRHIPSASSEGASSEGRSPQIELILDSLEPDKLNLVAKYDLSEASSVLPAERPAERPAGKPGFISFHALPYQRREEILESNPSKEIPKFVWFVGPTVLVAFLVFPSLYLRGILSTIFEDSLLTDFLILFFTEALFYGGAAIFLLLVDGIWRPSLQATPSNRYCRELSLDFVYHLWQPCF